MAEIPLLPCPHCGRKVSATYEGSSEWVINHLDERSHVMAGKPCISYQTIWVMASVAQWDADKDAEWNKMATIWNRRVPS